MKFIQKFTIFLSLLLFALVIKAQTLPPGFSVKKICVLSYPTCMAFAPDGRIFLGEENGTIRILKDSVVLSTPFYKLPSVYPLSEKGLIGLVLDPDFANNHYVYCQYTFSFATSGSSAAADVQNRIVRITANGDVGDTNSFTSILNLDRIPAFIINPNHDGGSLRFGPDGKLYISSGENTIWCPCTFEAGRKNCNGCTKPFPANFSQDMNHYLGKLIRVNPDGSAPTDNPFYSSAATEVEKRIYALGLRNPFTMHFRKGTSDLYINDVGSHGPAQREEINKVDGAGLNFGWNNVEGYVAQPKYTDPVYAYHGQNDVAATLNTGCAIAGGVFFKPTLSTFPKQYRDKYFFMDFCGGWINYLNVDSGMVKYNFASGLAGNVDTSGSGGIGSLALDEGTDGNLYFLSRSNTANVSGLYKISYAGPAFVDAVTNVMDKYDVNLFPNPAKAELNISLTDAKSQKLTIIIYDLLAKEKLNLEYNSHTGSNIIKIDLSQLGHGMYYVGISTEDGRIVKKLRVE